MCASSHVRCHLVIAHLLQLSKIPTLGVSIANTHSMIYDNCAPSVYSNSVCVCGCMHVKYLYRVRVIACWLNVWAFCYAAFSCAHKYCKQIHAKQAHRCWRGESRERKYGISPHQNAGEPKNNLYAYECVLRWKHARAQLRHIVCATFLWLASGVLVWNCGSVVRKLQLWRCFYFSVFVFMRKSLFVEYSNVC